MMQALYLFPLHRPASYNKYKGTLHLPHLYKNTGFILKGYLSSIPHPRPPRPSGCTGGGYPSIGARKHSGQLCP